jgi:hypothetical protein
LWKKEEPSDACGSAARSSNNVPGSSSSSSRVVEDVGEVVSDAIALANGSVSVDIPSDAISLAIGSVSEEIGSVIASNISGEVNVGSSKPENVLEPTCESPQQHVEKESAGQVSCQTDPLVMRCVYAPAEMINLMLETQALEEAFEDCVVTACVADPAEVFSLLLKEHQPLAVGSTQKE